MHLSKCQASTNSPAFFHPHPLSLLPNKNTKPQMLQYEVTRKQLLDKQEKKIEAMEARAAELQRLKAEHEREWAVAVRERELAKVRAVVVSGWSGSALRPIRDASSGVEMVCCPVDLKPLPQHILSPPHMNHPLTCITPPTHTHEHTPKPTQLAEEQERDREALRIAAERYRREREMHRKEAEDARRRKKEAFQRWDFSLRWGWCFGGWGAGGSDPTAGWGLVFCSLL